MGSMAIDKVHGEKQFPEWVETGRIYLLFSRCPCHVKGLRRVLLSWPPQKENSKKAKALSHIPESSVMQKIKGYFCFRTISALLNAWHEE